MFIKTSPITEKYTRVSKLGQRHTYSRTRTLVWLCCDSCGTEFSRALGHIDPRRLSNGAFHVCPQCNPKKFAQERGAERRAFWSTPVDKDLDISKF